VAKGLPGELQSGAKLTWAQVEEIRASRLPERALAEIYKVHRSNIGVIRRGEGWTVRLEEKGQPSQQ
jgi:hypothetical protein